MNILAVDDEPIMQNLYPDLINWEEYNFNFLGVAYNAFNALDIIRSEKIDIIITDIRMPQMTGIELIKEVKKEFPDIQFIIVSGYDDFSLVREALVLNVKNYLLKDEIDSENLLKTLLKLKNEIEEKHKNNLNNGDALQNQEYRLLQREMLIRNLVWGGRPQETVEQLKQYNINVNTVSLSIMVLSIVDYMSIEREVWNSERETFKYALMNVLNEYCEKFECLYPVYNSPGEYLFLCTSNNSIDINSFFVEISNLLSKCFDLTCNGGYSMVQTENDSLRNVFQEAKIACSYCFVVGNGKLVEYTKIRFSGAQIDISYYVHELKKMLLYFDAKNISSDGNKLRISSLNVGPKQVDEVKNLFYQYYTEMLNFVKEQNLDNEKIEIIRSFDRLKDKADLSEFNSWITDCLKELSNASLNFSKANRAKQYIRQNYHKQLTLDIVAAELEISGGHLSRLFQQAEGCSFSDFLTITRIAAAKKLMATTNLKIYEIAEQVGYTNIEQFSKRFKKITGVSPKVYTKEFNLES